MCCLPPPRFEVKMWTFEKILSPELEFFITASKAEVEVTIASHQHVSYTSNTRLSLFSHIFFIRN